MAIVYDPSAARAIMALIDDGRPMADRAVAALRGLATDPGDARFRRRSYAPNVDWGFVVRARDETLLILWDWDSESRLQEFGTSDPISCDGRAARHVGQDLLVSTPVYLEVGAKKVFACSLDWPGWCRAGKTEEQALEALAGYAQRYRPVAEEAGGRFPKSVADNLDVVERLKGDSGTDFGIPHVPADADATALTKAQAERLANLVAAAWTVFDRVAKSAPAELRKGPRGGGRDRDKMVAHVVDADNGYFRMVGVKDGRDAFLDALRAARRPQPELVTKTWPWRYTARRVAWHALDHAWEMQDRSE